MRTALPVSAYLLAFVLGACATNAPPVSRPAASAPAPPPAAAAPAPAPAAAPKAAPASFEEILAALRRAAESGKDPDLARHADLLAAADAAAIEASEEVRLDRLPDLEERAVEDPEVHLAFATVNAYVEPGASPEALRRAYLDFDRLHEWTGHEGTRTLSREGNVVRARSDSVRRFLAVEFGARWTFEARAVDRGAARLIVSRMVDDGTAEHMRSVRSVWIALPVAGGTRVIEASIAALDLDPPGLLRGIALSAARKEMLDRIAGLRAHWSDYAR